MSEDGRPSLGNRVRAALRGERRADALQALRAAGAAVYGELAEAERTRAVLAAGGGDIWSAAPAVGGQLLATWNAFVLQVLGERLLDGDYASDPGTVGYVPPVTFEQAWSWLATGAEWLNLARQARANPAYDPRQHFRLPADPPEFIDVEPCPQAHLDAMLAAIPAIQEHAELALYDLEKSSQREDRQQQVNQLHQMAAESASAVDYAVGLRSPAVDQRLHKYIEVHLQRALVLWFHIGQLTAMPTLIAGYRPVPAPAQVDPAAFPGGSRFDPWCLTDPRVRDHWRADPRARQAIQVLWALDPEPVRTLAIQAQIDQALAAGDIVRTAASGEPSMYFCCPWSSIYQVRRPVVIGGLWLSVTQRFTFDVSAEELAQGGAFIRRILTGPFHATANVDYCDLTDPRRRGG